MIDLQHTELVTLIERHTKSDGVTQTLIPGVSLFRASVLNLPVPSVYNPCLCIIAQGTKEVVLDKEMYRYGPYQYLTISIDLPMMNQITTASREKPYLLIKIDIDRQQLSELLMDSGLSFAGSANTKRGIFVGRVDVSMQDSVLRLARLLDSPSDIPTLAAQTLREIMYRVLCSDYGDMVAQMARKGSHVQNIGNAIQKLKRDFRRSISVDELAEIAFMSVSSFHAHFKAVTAMSPLQYQKTLRLIEARSQMLALNTDAATTAFNVGYQSASQFNREYARMFGNPPAKDIQLFRRQEQQNLS